MRQNLVAYSIRSLCRGFSLASLCSFLAFPASSVDYIKKDFLSSDLHEDTTNVKSCWRLEDSNEIFISLFLFI